MRCRKCSRVISLRHDQPSRSLKISVIRTDRPENSASDTLQPVFQTYTETANSGRRNVVLVTSAAALLFAVIAAAILFGYPLLTREPSPNRSTAENPVRSAPDTAKSEDQPLILLEADLPALRRELQKRLPKFTKDPRWRIASTVLNGASLQRAKLFLYPDPKNRILPVLILQGEKAVDLKRTLLHSQPWKRILIPAEGSAYRLAPDVVATASKGGFPAESYRIWFHSGWTVCAPLPQKQLWEAGKEHWNSFSVVRASETLEKPIQLTGLAARIPANLSHGWTRSLIPDSVRRNDPEAEQLFDAAAGFLALLDRSIQQIDSMAGVFQFVGKDGRLLQYAQLFREGVDSNRIFSRLQTEKTTLDRTSIAAIFSNLLQHDRLNTTVELYGRHLTVSVDWQADDDQILLKAVIEAVFGANRSNKEPGS